MSVPGSVNSEGKGQEAADDTPTGVLTPAQVEKGMELELQLAGLDDEEEEIQHRPKRAVKPDDYLQKKTPEQVFKEFDTDGSGNIDYDEFQHMITALGFNVSSAKALKYFRHIDEDGSGEIDMDEFRVALFMLDPVTGNTLGFQPSKLLTPSDAFEMFDEDRSGAIDEDEFYFALEYLGLKISDQKQEKFFNKYDKDNSGTIDYEEFMAIWLETGNVRQELINRGIEVTKWMTKRYMRRRLREIVDEEELAERKTLKLAKQWAAWRKEQMDKEADLDAARKRAEAELATALDVGGQVYMLGRGIAQQFKAKPVRPDMYGFDRIKEMWRKRLNLDENGNPIEKKIESDDEDNDGSGSSGDEDGSSTASSVSVDRFNIPPVNMMRRASLLSQHSERSMLSAATSTTSGSVYSSSTLASGNSHPALVGKTAATDGTEGNVEDQDEWEVAKFQLNPYEGLTMAYNTAPLWGRRIQQVDFGQSTAFAVSDMGEMFVWGGKHRWWTDFQPDSKWVKRDVKPGKLTERSDWQMTMGVPDDVVIPKLKKESFQGDGPQVVPPKLQKKLKDKKRKKRMRKKRKENMDKLAVLHEENESSDDSLSTLGSLASDLDDNEEVRKLKLKQIAKLKRKKRRKRKAAEAKAAEEAKEKAEAEAKEMAEKLKEQTFIAGPDGENLYEVDPYALDELQENRLKAQLRRKKQAREDDKKADMLKLVTQYYGVWEPSPTAAQRLAFLENVLMPKVTFEQLQTSLKLRGRVLGAHTKSELTAMLGECLATEITQLADDEVKELREMERAIEAYMVRNQGKKARKLKARMLELWEPLLVIQEEERVKREQDEAEAITRNEQRFEDAFVKEKVNKAACLHETRKFYTPRGTHPYVSVGGITYRGPRLHTFRGGSAVRCLGAGAHHVVAVHTDGEVYAWGVGDAGRLGFGDGEDGAEGGMGGRGFPTLLKDLRGVRMLHCACGYAHSVAVSSTGQLFAWGSAMHGQVGLGPVDSRFDLFCPRPTLIRMPHSVMFKRVACGPTYSMAITIKGHLYVWGNADSGKLGIGIVRGDIYEPTLVKNLAERKVRVAKVSCGNSHAVLCTDIDDVYHGGAHNRLHTYEGGQVYICGSSTALGEPVKQWRLVEELLPVRVRDVAAGFSHTAVCTNEGEMFTWGANVDGCLGFPPAITFVAKPRLVRAMYVRPKNIASNQHSVVTQSSVYNGLGPELAIDGDASGDGEWACIHTQREKQPWWQLDLGQNASIEKIVIWNRNDIPFDRSQKADAITKRLFPSWVIVSQHEFQQDLGANLNRCIFKRRIKDNQRRTIISLPQATVARFIRIQLEGENYLHFAQMEVYGTYGDYYKVGRVSHVAATHGATVVSMGPVIDEADVRNAYKKAVRSDSNNAVILRQLPMYYKYFDEYGRGESMTGPCPCCTVETRCEMCTLEQKWGVDNLERGPLGRLRRLDSFRNILLAVPPPELEWDEDVTRQTTFKEMVNKKVQAAAKAIRAWKEGKAKAAWRKARNGLLGFGGKREEEKVEAVVQQYVPRGPAMTFQTKKVFRPPTPPSEYKVHEITERPTTADSGYSAGSARSGKSAGSVVSRAGTAVSGMMSVFGFGKKKKPQVSRKTQRRQKEEEWAERIAPDAPKMPAVSRQRHTGLTPRANRRGRLSTAGSRSSMGSGSSYTGSRAGTASVAGSRAGAGQGAGAGAGSARAQEAGLMSVNL